MRASILVHIHFLCEIVLCCPLHVPVCTHSTGKLQQELDQAVSAHDTVQGLLQSKQEEATQMQLDKDALAVEKADVELALVSTKRSLLDSEEARHLVEEQLAASQGDVQSAAEQMQHYQDEQAALTLQLTERQFANEAQAQEVEQLQNEVQVRMYVYCCFFSFPFPLPVPVRFSYDYYYSSALPLR